MKNITIESANILEHNNIILFKLLKIYCLFNYSRSLIFPLTTRGGKGTPFTPYISALIFCLFNGLMQGRYLLNYHCYEDTWIYTPQFILGASMSPTFNISYLITLLRYFLLCTGMSLFCIGMAINIHSGNRRGS